MVRYGSSSVKLKQKKVAFDEAKLKICHAKPLRNQPTDLLIAIELTFD